jgi:hypothetical protein
MRSISDGVAKLSGGAATTELTRDYKMDTGAGQ